MAVMHIIASRGEHANQPSLTMRAPLVMRRLKTIDSDHVQAATCQMVNGRRSESATANHQHVARFNTHFLHNSQELCNRIRRLRDKLETSIRAQTSVRTDGRAIHSPVTKLTGLNNPFAGNNRRSLTAQRLGSRSPNVAKSQRAIPCATFQQRIHGALLPASVHSRPQFYTLV